MKFIRIESHPYDVGYHKNMKRTGEIKTQVDYVNKEEISSIGIYVGQKGGLHKDKVGAKIKMHNGDTFIDAREPKEIVRITQI